MLMDAHSSSSISPPPSWHPVILVPSHHQQQQQQQVHYNLDLATPSPSPSTPATASPARQSHLGPASRRGGKQKQRRPRPSRKLPTTYISADAASFRRMVHQVTGADDVVLVHQQATKLLCRPAAPPSRAALTTATATLVPTLDTSAFLLGAAARGAGGGGGGVPPARPGAPSSCHGSAVPTVVGPGADAALQAEACGGGGGGGFPSLESWDEDDGLF